MDRPMHAHRCVNRALNAGDLLSRTTVTASGVYAVYGRRGAAGECELSRCLYCGLTNDKELNATGELGAAHGVD